MKIKYRPMELHSHTLHSDGVFTPEELCRAAKDGLYDGIVLTDHNTMSGLEYISEELQKETVPVIPGIEWTTYFGHMLVLGAEYYIDWRFARPEDIDQYTEQIRETGAAVGVAHPFAVGSPMCTGCHWDFNITNWNYVDYIEIWNGPNPQGDFISRIAIDWWTKLLNEGNHLACTSGRDWHGPDTHKGLSPTTYVGFEDGEINKRTVREALRAGRTFVSIGPVLSLSFVQGEKEYFIGDTINNTDTLIKISIDENNRREIWSSYSVKSKEIRIVNNGEIISSFAIDGDASVETSVKPNKGWLRIEVYGDYTDFEEPQLLAISSPIYID